MKRARAVEPSSVRVDVAFFGVWQGRLHVLVLERRAPPFRGAWALPGVPLLPDEALAQAAERALVEHAGLVDVKLIQVQAADDLLRAPRAVSVLYMGFSAGAPRGPFERAGIRMRWVPVVQPGVRFAFMHEDWTLAAARLLASRLRGDENPGVDVLRAPFSLQELHEAYEAALGEAIDKRNFRARMKRLVESTGLFRTGKHRPAELFRFRVTA